MTDKYEPRPASQKQQNLIMKLCKQQGKNLPPGLVEGTMTIDAASAWIENNLQIKGCFK